MTSRLFAVALCLSALGCEATQEPAPEWTRLVEGTWSLPTGSEDPRWCGKTVVTEDTYVQAIRPVHPLGTHHTTLSLRDDDGATGCTGSVLGPDIIYAAGLGSGELHLPEGVAIKLRKGQALYLGLHIYNATGAPLSGTSALEVVRADAAQMKYEADMLVAGPLGFSLVAGPSTVKHQCTIKTEQTLFNIFPHMHQLGTHLKSTAMVGGQPILLHDGDYKFNEQYQLPITPVTLRDGDTITTECTYENDTGKVVTFGESSDTEMCFSVLFRYPSNGTRFCASAAGGGDGGMNMPCAHMGDPGNDKGVGKYCTKGGGECSSSEASLCLADVLSSAFANFCTKLCSMDSDCGLAAKCAGSGAQKGCVPLACAGMGN